MVQRRCPVTLLVVNAAVVLVLLLPVESSTIPQEQHWKHPEEVATSIDNEGGDGDDRTPVMTTATAGQSEPGATTEDSENRPMEETAAPTANAGHNTATENHQPIGAFNPTVEEADENTSGSNQNVEQERAVDDTTKSPADYYIEDDADGVESDDRTWLDVFGEVTKEYLTKRVIPATDIVCQWDWRVARCEPFCACDFQPQWGDYHLGRSCRRRSAEQQQQICGLPPPMPKFDPAKYRGPRREDSGDRHAGPDIQDPDDLVWLQQTQQQVVSANAAAATQRDAPWKHNAKQALFGIVTAMQSTRDYLQTVKRKLVNRTKQHYEQLQEDTCSDLLSSHEDSLKIEFDGDSGDANGGRCVPSSELSWKERLLCRRLEDVCGNDDGTVTVGKEGHLWTEGIYMNGLNSDDPRSSQSSFFTSSSSKTFPGFSEWSAGLRTSNDWSAGVAVPPPSSTTSRSKLKRRPMTSGTNREASTTNAGGSGGFARMSISPTTKLEETTDEIVNEAEQAQDEAILKDTATLAAGTPENDAGIPYWQFHQEDEASHGDTNSSLNTATIRTESVAEGPVEHGTVSGDAYENSVHEHIDGSSMESIVANINIGKEADDVGPIYQHSEGDDSLQPQSSETVPPVI